MFDGPNDVLPELVTHTQQMEEIHDEEEGQGDWLLSIMVVIIAPAAASITAYLPAHNTHFSLSGQTTSRRNNA